MIVQNALVTFSYSGGTQTRSLYCTMLIGRQILGEIVELIDMSLEELFDDGRLIFRMNNFCLEYNDAAWLADFLYATDKIVRYDSIEFPVVNDDGNYDVDFDQINGSSARATCDLAFLECDPTAHGGMTRVTVDDETRETSDGEIRVTAGGGS
jgi:hypothetical protein